MRTSDPKNELRRVLSEHAARYPAMRPADAVKLLYQNEFGGGHLISDSSRSLQMLRDESAAVVRNANAPLAEDIGNGMVRIMLNALEESAYPLEQLNEDFVRSAALHTGNGAAFLGKLDVLRTVTAEGVYNFSAAELEDYLTGYIAAGCPAVSHSPEYRAAYAPAYRVLRRRTSLPLLLQELQTLCSARETPVLAAIDGRCASGKSTLAGRLAERYGWSVIHMDDFFPRPEQRTPERYATPGGNIDYERLLSEVLIPLRQGRLTQYRRFDCRNLRLTEAVPVRPSPAVLIEGSYSCHPELWEYYDLHVFLTVDAKEQLRRVAARNGTAQAEVFREKWIPLEERYFSAFSVETACEYSLRLTEAMRG